jgi:predicted ATPase
MRRELPAGTVTFLFTDVEGSTKLLHELGSEAYAEKLAEHRQVVREACTARDGVEVDTQGDAFFVAFPTAAEALEAARAITEELASGPIALRIGLHTGTPLLTEEGYVGEDVHFAARVAASAHGGQVVVSQATRALVEAYPLVELGEHRLKDIAEPVAIFQLGDEQFPPLKTISNTNLPRPASSFVGRERELQEVLARIEEGTRLLTLSGPGGSGKTRLALETAATLVPEYKAGVFWVGLAPLRQPALVTETIAQTLGAKDGLAEHIGEREMLLLLDNLEQVIEAAPELSSLLQGCPNLTLLVTSRELLRVQGEVEYAVPPLAEAEAVSLFCERAQVEPSEDVAELCRRLDSLPLAVELAAARTKALSPTQILARLSQRLDLLKGGRDADPRQQTLRATIAWSYDLLSEHEQELFRRLSVFSGGCTLEAAEDVCYAGLDTLQSLVEKSLLRFSTDRYWILETIREFAGEQLDESPEAEQVRARYLGWALALAEAARRDLRGPEQSAWYSRLQAEHLNLRAALEHALSTGQNMVLARLVWALFRFWMIRGHLQEGRRWTDEAAARLGGLPPELRAQVASAGTALAATQGDVTAWESYGGQALALYSELGDPRASGALRDLAGAAFMLGDTERALALSRESVEIARADGDRLSVAHAVANTAVYELSAGNIEAAAALLDEGLRLYREFDDDEGMGFTLINLGHHAAMRGDERQAAGAYNEALSLALRIGWQEGISFCLDGLASVSAALDEPERGARLAGAAEAIRAAHGIALSRFDRRLHESTVQGLRAVLGPAVFEYIAAVPADETEAVIEEALHYEAWAKTGS